ncbi:MAG TPA: cytochrome c [Gemmatimonadaceae bacterium]|nr:cytochrome c [Gemmatimonadaceae bacterium]
MPLLIAPAIAGVVGCRGRDRADGERPMRTVAPTVASGQALWTQFCASCHVMPAGADKALGPVLISREYLAFATNARLDSLITYGIPGTTMLGWGKGASGTLDETQVRSLIYYLRAQEATAPSDPKWKEGRKVSLP